ncbi:MAG: hypothetical protein NT103_06125 [Campylobacterales bacterium]|nr:hypothetical protein [Campylobacterales bacterium]
MENREQNSSIHASNIKFLTPTSDADPRHTYRTALTKAINQEGVTNIAISGSYGAGKTSIINTFLDEQTDKNKYIRISLASFKSANNTSNDAGNTTFVGDGIGLTIEKSILQQIFYKVEKSKLPYSKLKRIVEPESWTLTRAIVILLIFAVLGHLSLDTEYLLSIVGANWIVASGWFVTILTLFIGYFMLHYGAKYLSSLKLDKVTIKDAEFSLGGDKDDDSLINRHIDEILYFFETTPYKYLIIEDLDRYGNIAIYEKLRELNTLINNYDKIKSKKEKVIFIYAIKDDFFVGENRSKFFNIIIPVVPYINASGNSRDLFVKDLRDAGISETVVSDQLLKDISKFVHDRRLLTNIINEFLIYLDELNPELDLSKINPEKLFCMIVYKNFFPSDFADLHQSKGWLYDVFNKKRRDLQKKIIGNLETEIENIHVQVTEAKQEVLSSEIELRSVYLIRIINEMNIDVKAIFLNGSWLTLRQILANESLFRELLKGGSIQIQHSNGAQTYGNCSSYENEYISRINRVRNNNTEKIDELKIHLASLQSKRSLTLTQSMAKMMIAYPNHGVFDDQKDLYEKAGYSEEDIACKLEAPNLLAYFIREEKISRDYAAYISYYHSGGSLSPSDNEFIIRVIEGVISDIDLRIDNPALVIDELSENKFLSQAILNMDIIATLYENQGKYQEHCNIIFNLLKNEENARSFIPIFIQEDIIRAGKFVKYFIEHDVHFWKRMEAFDISDAKLFVLLCYMLGACDKETLLAQGDALKDYIFRSGDVLFTIPNAEENSMLLMLLPVLDGKFSNVDVPMTDEGEQLFNCMVEFNLYEITAQMIATVMIAMGNEAFDEYTSTKQVTEYAKILNSNIDTLKQYIEENINEYVSRVYLQTLDGEISTENEESILALIQHKALSKSMKNRIIESIATRISNVSEIEFDPELFYQLFLKIKVAPTWENIYNYYSNIGNVLEIDEALAAYLTNLEIATTLSQTKFTDSSTQRIFSKAIIFNPYMMPELLRLYRVVIAPFDDISGIDCSEKIITNVYNAGFINSNATNYEYLQIHTTGLHLKMIEADFERAMGYIIELPFDKNNALYVLQSKKISAIQRFVYLSKIGLTALNEADLFDPISEILYAIKDNGSIIYDFNFLTYASKSSLEINQKIELVMKIIDSLSTEQIYSFLEDLEGHYKYLRPSEGGKRSYEFANNKYNQLIFKKLEGLEIVGKVHIFDNEITVNRKKKVRSDRSN